MSIGILLFSISPFIVDGGVYVMFMLGLILGVVGSVFEPIKKKVVN